MNINTNNETKSEQDSPSSPNRRALRNAGFSVTREHFGKLPDGTDIDAFTLQNPRGMRVKVITYGAIISECWVPDKKRKLENVVLGFNSIDGYLAKHPRFGSTIGRYANRIANAQFELDGKTYKLAANKGSSCIHGGEVGFDKRVWTASNSEATEHEAWVTLKYLSKDMEEGFPGNLNVKIVFSLDAENSLSIHYTATTDKPTPVNLTNHSYFNLKGAGNGDILEHIVSFNAQYYTPLNENLTPTGEIASVKDTPYDFTTPAAIGARIAQTNGGYDINYVHVLRPGRIDEIGSVTDPSSGRQLTVASEQPAFQFFTANSLDGSHKGIGGIYQKHGGFCLETQAYPNSVNEPKFPNTILRPDQSYSSFNQFSFSAVDPKDLST